MGAFSGRLATRFLVVTVLPSAVLLGYIGFLIAAGAPTRPLHPPQALHALEHPTPNAITAAVLLLLAVSVASHPLQIPLIHLLEGYWWGVPFGSKLAKLGTARFEREHAALQGIVEDIEASGADDWESRNRVRHASSRLNWLPLSKEDLLPTALGNTLWRGENVAGNRYCLSMDVALPRLAPLLDPKVLAELSDLRNQLDAAARFCLAAAVATVASIGLLLRDGPWLFMAVGTYCLSWVCYQSAIAAARRFSGSLSAAVDLYHLNLYDALSLERPSNLKEERKRNAVLSKLFRSALTDEEMDCILYTQPKREPSPADQENPAPTQIIPAQPTSGNG